MSKSEYMDICEQLSRDLHLEREAHRDTLAKLYAASSKLSSGPWMVVKGRNNVGHGWPVASLGADHNGVDWYIETSGVHASEAVSEPQADAEAIVAWRNSMLARR